MTTVNSPNTDPHIYSEYDDIHRTPIRNPLKVSQDVPSTPNIPVNPRTQIVHPHQNNPEVQSVPQGPEEQNILHVNVQQNAPYIPAISINNQSLKEHDGHVPVSDPEPPFFPAHQQIPSYVNTDQNISPAPSVPSPVFPVIFLRKFPNLFVLVGPQHTPQIPFVSQNIPIVTSAHTNAPQVPYVSQNSPHVTVAPNISHSNSPQAPFISQNAEVPIAPVNGHKNSAQVPFVSQKGPKIPFVPENSAQILLVPQNSQVPLVPINAYSSSPQVPTVPQNAPEFPAVTGNTVQITQAPFVSKNIPNASSVKPQNPNTYVDYSPQYAPHVPLVPINPQNEVPQRELVSQNVPETPVAPVISNNVKYPTEISQTSSESSGKVRVSSDCPITIKERSENKYPILTFKNVLNPPENIQEYYQKASAELDKSRFFRCHRDEERSYVSSPDWLAYHCHNDEIPMKLLVEVPRTVPEEPIIDVELETPYSVMAIEAWDEKYEGIERKTFLEDLQTPCSYGVVVLKPEGLSTRIVPMPISTPDGKFIIHKVKM